MALLALLYSLAGCTTLKSPRRIYNRMVRDQQRFDAIIVPGIPFEGKAWNNVMKARVLWSYLLYKEGRTRNVIYSGGAVYSPYVEAKIMGLYAQQLGIPPEHIFCDTLAEHSTENVYYSYELARRLGFKTLAVATEYNQALLLKRFVKRRFLSKVAILPIYESYLEAYAHLEPLIDPTPALEPGFVSILQRQTLGKRLRGTMGGNLPWKNLPGRKAPPL